MMMYTAFLHIKRKMIICAETYNNNVFAHNISMMENGK